MDSGLGEAIIGGGLEDELRQPMFSIGLKGVKPEDMDKVSELIKTTIAELAESGFTDTAAEAAMNTIEFSLRENNTGRFPRGEAPILKPPLPLLINWEDALMSTVRRARSLLFR